MTKVEQYLPAALIGSHIIYIFLLFVCVFRILLPHGLA